MIPQPTGFTSFEQAQSFVQQHQIRVIDLKFCDLWGRWHHLTLSASQFTPQLMAAGVGFDGSSVGLKSVKAGDMVLLPDLRSGRMDPFHDAPTLSFICSTRDAQTMAVFPNDPRNIAMRAEAYLHETGIATDSRWGPEFEFYIFDDVAIENEMGRAGYRIAAAEADWDGGNGRAAHTIPAHGGYHAIPPKDSLYNLRTAMMLRLEEMGVPVKYHHHEVGGPGQVEIETAMMPLTAAGDAAMLAKYICKMLALQHGKVATFMPKPLYNEAGTGMHFHQHLFRNDQNLFYDADGYGCLSELARYYVGGLLAHGPALLALTNPSTNSYRRLVPGFEAPVNAFYSLGNRSAAVRIPSYAHEPETTRIEFRPPDATGNIYLMLVAQLLAGIDGIQRRIDPTENGYGPIDADIFGWSAAQKATIQALPTTLDAALDALEADHAFLLAGGVFSTELIEQWVTYKRETESRQVRNRPHPYEMALYFDV